MEGVRLWKELPKSQLVLSGGTISSRKMATGMGMELLAQEIGVPKDAIVVESQSWDTEDEARLLKPVLGKTNSRLVTSACHMRRSVLHFKRMGLDHPRAPDFLTKDFQQGFGGLIPSPDALAMSQAAIHEYLGTLWLEIKQLFSVHAAGRCRPTPSKRGLHFPDKGPGDRIVQGETGNSCKPAPARPNRGEIHFEEGTEHLAFNMAFNAVSFSLASANGCFSASVSLENKLCCRLCRALTLPNN